MKIKKNYEHTEQYAEKYLTDHGFTFRITKQTLSRSEWEVEKDGCKHVLSIPLQTKDMGSFMRQWEKQFTELEELKKLRKRYYGG